MRVVRLSDVAEINPVTHIGGLGRDAPVSFLAMADVSEDGGLLGIQTRPLSEVSRGYTPFRRGDAIVAKITPCFENGKSALLDELPSEIGYGSTEFHVVRAGTDLHNRFLHFLLRSPRFREMGRRRMTGSAGQKRVPQSYLDEFEFSLPSLAEQQRIAAILDKAEAIHRKRREALSLADEILRCVFLEIAQGIRNGTTAGEIKQISALLSDGNNSIRTGPFGSDLLHSEFTAHGVPVLGIENVVTNRFRWTEPRCISFEKYKSLKRFRVFPEDVIITIMGTTGRVCVAPAGLPECISTKHLCVLTPDTSKVSSLYLWASLLFDPVVRRQTAQAGKGAIMEGWNMTIVRELEIAVPSTQALKRFDAAAKRIECLRASHEALELESEQLFGSLSSRVFNVAPGAPQ
jgi:type I restriction enzyme, S subunit